MPLGALPQNQIEALPLQTAAEATAATSITIVGNKVVKYWSPAACGINGQFYPGDPDNGTQAALFSNWLDVRGCNEYLVVWVATITANAGRESGISQGPIQQYRVPNGLGGYILPHSADIGTTMFTGLAGRTPDMSAFLPQSPYLMTFAFQNDTLGGIEMGFDMRLWFRSTVGHNPNQAYSMHLWGQGS